MKRKQFIVLLIMVFIIAGCRQTAKFPVTDLHIHIKGGFTLEDAVRKSEAENIQYGIVVNCGLGFPVQNDSQVDSFLLIMDDYPNFYRGMQAEGREWVNLFSKESIEKFDYVFTDAMTFTDEKGRRNRIWQPDETFIDNEEEFMNYLVKTLVTILNTEPIDIYVNATFLPSQMDDRYDLFWTEKRMDEVINALVTNNIAMEINNRFEIPSAAFIKRAKKAGVKFTVGTNNTDANFSGAGYALDMIKECNLTESDFWLPARKKL
jgi:hypothetical protein